MKGKLICYELENITASERTMLQKKLYGYKDYSNRGKYIYERLGILQKVNGIKIINAVLFIENEAATEKVIDILQEYQAKIYIFEVISMVER